MVFHIKDGREHCHVVWSRIDAQAGKAIHMAFDHQKLMMVTREFARDHGLKLPAGYERNAAAQEKNRQLSLYEKEQQRRTGISKERRIEEVTDAWRRSDTARAFVRALEERGYILCTGDKRPYVLVDLYGSMNALPKLIGDRSVRTKDIRAFLEREFPPESLPTVEEARALVAQHRQAQEDFARTQRDHRKRDQLKEAQAQRRAQALADRAALDAGQRVERFALAEAQRLQRLALKRSYVRELRRVHDARKEARPTGLAAFLGRVTGVSLVIRQVQRYQDTKRWEVYRTERAALIDRQRAETAAQQQRHKLQAFDANRALRSLDQIDARELKSFETRQTKAERVKQRGGSGRMPALALELKPRGRGAILHKAAHRHHKRDFARSEPSPGRPPVVERPMTGPIETIKEEFSRVASQRQVDDHHGDRDDRGSVRPTDDRRDRRHDDRDRHADDAHPGQAPAAARAPDAPEPHWTELPLADEFWRAAREREAERDDGDDRFRPSRATRRSDRSRGQDRDDFERER